MADKEKTGNAHDIESSGEVYLTNSLTAEKEKFTPINPPNVGVYTCGPTVYDTPTIGNLRTFTTSDLLVRILKYNGYEVKYVMNLTDVGHLTGDADSGEDKVEKAAKEEGKTAWDIAEENIEDFKEEMQSINLITPDIMPRATEHVKEQIELVKKLEEGGFVYKTSDGIYFDTEKFEGKTGKSYGELSTLDDIKEGARVEKNVEKKNARDFALWKFSDKPGERHMEWESPWGLGFPGWHVECSAMSMKYLGETFDIHVGGEDLRQTHHPNEIAQSEGATGKKFVNYWIHGTFLKVDGKKMSKSMGNFYTLENIREKGYDPLALRYLYLTAGYRDTLNFTWDALSSAQNALDRAREQLRSFRGSGRTTLSQEKRQKVDRFTKEFRLAINDDINTPRALAVFWEAMKSNIPSEDKYDLAISFDEIFGLRLSEAAAKELKVPEKVKKLVKKRTKLRQQGEFDEADNVRKKIEEEGYFVRDTDEGSRIVEKKTARNGD